jgi:hypothetical protein
MSRALVTLATGSHREMLDLARPSFEEFADRHGYEIVEPELESSRAPSWWKVPALRAVLSEYDEALWVDADIVIVDPSEDLNVPEEAWQALVRHQTGDGDVPNCGVWFVRRPMREVLDLIWAQTQRIDHGWWEQAALMDHLGFNLHPAGLVKPTLLYQRTHWLDGGWNVHRWDTPGPIRPRFLHATMHPDRVAVMREWAEGDVPEVPGTPCRHLYPILQATDNVDCCFCAPVGVAA